ncbi:PB1-F2 protein [Influenza A virus]|nr:PB1-F2 protein [Influenza A virus]BBC70838.1 PB1-F2 protein [Influenza A virus]BBD75615.1 PB1-F2 protein [Influenza A virus]BBD75626.1 PB1-F2 protein [Influenza A virus]BBD75637.1 PB1-F2 protein [Influenza A virus]
MEQEQDIPWTQ